MNSDPKNPKPPKARTEYTQTGAEDILTVAYRLEQTAKYRDKEDLRHFVPTSGWLLAQAKILREALKKEGWNV